MLPGVQITIRPLASVEEYAQVEDLERRVWRIDSAVEIVPLHMLKAVVDNGGLLLVAVTPQGELVGFVFGFLARCAGRLTHHSHMMGVLPELQGSGVGFLLKCAQRQAVLAQGLNWITWTYDPLEGRNGHLNIAKLGAVCRTYIRDMYGELRDGLNVGLATDRFQVDWVLDSPRVKERLAGDSAPLHMGSPQVAKAAKANSTRRAGGVRLPEAAAMQTASPELLIEIPGDFQALRSVSMDAARQWRLHTRGLFERYFQAGYTVTGCVSEVQNDERRSYYLLEKGTTGSLIPDH